MKKGKPLDVQIYERTRAHHIIEEFMLAANRTVAEEYFWQELPFVYRVHETPDVEKINELDTFVENFGYVLKTNQDGEIPSERDPEVNDRSSRNTRRSIDQPFSPSFHEAGTLYNELRGTFRTCHEILLSFYFTDQTLSVTYRFIVLSKKIFMENFLIKGSVIITGSCRM